jgi:putative ABC transport system permease protein
VNYKYYYKVESEARVNRIVEEVRPAVRRSGYSFETVERRKEGLGRGFSSIYRFFSLLAFVALILGCMGVASSVHIYAREKRDEVDVLRCEVIPLFIKNIIPFEMGFAVSWKSLLLGMSVGAVVSVLFSMLPLVAVRYVPPLSVLRADYEGQRVVSKTRIAAIVLIAAFPIAFASIQARSLFTGSMFFLGLVVALAFLYLVAIALLFLVRRFFPVNAGFTWRHALSSLFRPNNQTRVLMVTIGLGAFIISTLNIVEQSMLGQVEFTGRENQSNTILFDIQPSQKEGVIQLMKDNNLKINQVVPIVTCRISELKGRSAEELQRDTTDNVSNWAITREYRVTYRDSLHHSEILLEGSIHEKKNARDSIWVTISEGMLDNLDVKVGDSLVFDVQGVPVKAFIAGVREVDWPKDPPNFIFVFPTGVLENAPQIFVTATRVDEPAQANRFQQALVMEFPNVSLLDLRLILTTVNELFDKLGLIIRFLALFSIVTGLVVLAGAVINSKFLRIKENVLLRTIGARTKQITRITLIEYAYLGLFSALTGMALSLGGGFLLTKYFFEITFAFDWVELLVISVGVVILTVAIGWFNSREVISTPPLQILRKET